MNKSFLLLWLLFATTAARSQDTTPAELLFKKQLAEPSYGLAKIKVLIDVEQRKFKRPYQPVPLPSAIYDSLSPQEKFTYAMIHPESYRQNCSIYPANALSGKGRLFGRLAGGFDENSISIRQRTFLHENKTLVMQLIREQVDQGNAMGTNYKEAIVEIDGWELIPFLVRYYAAAKNDRELLTSLMLLMKHGAFDPFTTASCYEQLYGKNSNYRSSIDYSAVNEQFLLKTAMAYYQKRSAKS